MKIKLTTLLFGLLLAVGWTSNAFAQSTVLAAQDMANWKYKWLPAGATDSVEANYVYPDSTGKYVAPKVTNPYQIYDLLRAVYMDKRLPGPYYSAYTYDYQREDAVYYGGIGGGWGIPGSSNVTTSAVGNITINMTNGNFSFRSIEVRSNGTVIPNCSWSYSANGTNLPNNNWSSTKTFTNESSTSSCYMANGGTITINSSLLQGYTNVEVVINGRHDPNYQDDVTITVSGSTGTSTNRTITQSQSSWSDYSFTINGNTSGTNDKNFYKPNQEGYTALVVALYNDTTKIHDESNDPFDGAWEFANKTEAIQYITDNIEYVKLLTDGLRIGNASEHTTGTVFNCDGTYNKFFFLGKGQARKKSPRALGRIANSSWGITGEIYCEEGPFKYMYEEFSPTSGDQGADIFDFYSTMMEGKVYNVVHDCASVIQNKHQFSMSGKKGTQAYALSGLNFFIPDYRLLFWTNTFTYSRDYASYPYTRTVDGRDMNPYEEVDNTGNRTVVVTANSTSAPFSHWSVYYAQYNPDFAPKVGIYKITLEADAHPCTDYNETTNPYYEVTLNWTSSLNEMSGHPVDQTYIIYEVVYNPTTNQEELVPIATVENTTTYTLACPPNYKQGDYSQTHTYVIKGWPTDSDHPSFIAWSNQDDVVIPGLKDFLKLDLDHYESDFKIAEERNYYRNFLMVTNENDLKALTTADLMNGMTKYTIYRYDIDNDTVMTPFAEINFTKPTSVDATTVNYTITYLNQNIEDGNNSKYARSAMGIPDNGTLSVKGSGDVIIWPNGLSVNFMEITVKSGNNTIFRWTANSANPTTGSWTRSPGCKWVKYGNAYYLEGMGYIAIPAGTNGDVTVTIKAYGDGSTTSKITVNDVTRAIANGAENATEYEWTVPAANRAPKRDGNDSDNNATNNN